MEFKIGIIGVGFVGSAVKKSFEELGLSPKCYDKYKEEYQDFESVCDSEIIFLNLPTPMIKGGAYDKSSIYETLDRLEASSFSGVAVVKSTVEPGTVYNLNKKYSFYVVHSPEFLTERTAYEDFHNQRHVVLGIDNLCEETINLIKFFKIYYPAAKVSACSSKESEAMKLFCNNFYAMKIMIFNEFFSLCEKMDMSYSNIVSLMLENGWINEMHTKVPGPDGKLAYGGNCFVKDTEALREFAERKGALNRVLTAAIKERDLLRKDKNNLIYLEEK